MVETDFQIGINAVPLLSSLTGIGQYTYHLIAELQKILKTQPQLFYATGWSEELRSKSLPAMHGFIKRMAKKVIPKTYYLSRQLQQHYFSKGVRKHKIQLYHEPNFVSYPYSGPTIITIHDLSYVRYPETHPIERIRHMEKHMPRSIEDAQHIIVDSNFVKREVMEYYGVAEKKITTVYLGVSSKFRKYSSQDCEATLTQYGLEYGKYILGVGALEPRKNIAVVIDAFSQLPVSMRREYPLVLTGINHLSCAALNKKIEKLVQKGEVRLLGYTPQTHMPMLYSGTKVFVYPSIYEGFGLPPLEAIRCGTPVLASNCEALVEVISKGATFLGSDDNEGWTEKIQLILETTLDEQKKEGIILPMQCYSWENCAKEILKVYHQVLKI